MSFKQWTIENQYGDRITLLNYGARLINWSSRLAGDDRNLVLAYKANEDYLEDDSYLNVIAGPYANRIANGAVVIGGKEVRLGQNEGQNLLHGGNTGWDKVFWQLEEQGADFIVLSGRQPAPSAGTEGFPGNVEFQVCYSIEQQGELTIKFSAITDEPTVIGPTGHAYFNLSGDKTINDHQLMLNAEQFTVVSEMNIPTGELQHTTAEKDFARVKKIAGIALDHNFVINNASLNKAAALLQSPDDSLSLAVYSDYPGLQVYTAEHLNEKLGARAGICLEPQFFPNSPNEVEFEFQLTAPEQPFDKTIRYQLSNSKK